jgi:hypothetical protein
LVAGGTQVRTVFAIAFLAVGRDAQADREAQTAFPAQSERSSATGENRRFAAVSTYLAG